MCGTQRELYTYLELTTSGLSRGEIMKRVREGKLQRVRRGVYSTADACALSVTAAVHGGRLACVAAARHLGLWVLDDDVAAIHVSVGAHGRSHTHPECTCVVHWDAEPAVDEFGLPSVPRILRQILGCRGLEAFFVSLESAMRLRKITGAGIAWLFTHTNAAARDAIRFACCDADSGLESLLRWRLRTHRLRIRSQVDIISVGIVDFLIGDSLIVEVDGRRGHDDGSSRHKDLQRDANAAVWGYITLRFDYAMVVHDWPTVERAILAHVDRKRHLRMSEHGIGCQ